MQQPEARALYSSLLKTEKEITPDLLIKVATDQGFSPAQLQLLAQVHNSASTIAHLRNAGNSPTRGNNFSTIDVNDLTSKYASMNVPLKSHPPIETTKTAAPRRVNIVETDNRSDAFNWFGDRKEKAAGLTIDDFMGLQEKVAACECVLCPECASKNTKEAGESVTCSDCGHGYEDEVRIPLQCALESGYIGKLKTATEKLLIRAQLNADKDALEANNLISGIGGVLKTAKFYEIQQDLSMASDDAVASGLLLSIKRAGDEEFDAAKHPRKFVAADRHGVIPTILKAAKLVKTADAAEQLVDYCNTIIPRLRDYGLKIASGDAEALEKWQWWVKQAAPVQGGWHNIYREPTVDRAQVDEFRANDRAIAEAAARALSGAEARADDSGDYYVGGRRATDGMRINEVNGSNPDTGGIEPPRNTPPEEDPPREAPPRPTGRPNFLFLPVEEKEKPEKQTQSRGVQSYQPTKSIRDILRGMRSDVASMAPDRSKDTSTIRDGVRDARTAALMMRFMHTDDVISSAEPRRVVQLSNDLINVSPDLAAMPERFRAALREAIAYDGTTVDGLTSQAKLTKEIPAAQQAAYKQKGEKSAPTPEVETEKSKK